MIRAKKKLSKEIRPLRSNDVRQIVHKRMCSICVVIELTYGIKTLVANLLKDKLIHLKKKYESALKDKQTDR